MQQFIDVEIQLSPQAKSLIDAHDLTPGVLLERAVNRAMFALPIAVHGLPPDRRRHLRLVDKEAS